VWMHSSAKCLFIQPRLTMSKAAVSGYFFFGYSSVDAVSATSAVVVPDFTFRTTCAFIFRRISFTALSRT